MSYDYLSAIYRAVYYYFIEMSNSNTKLKYYYRAVVHKSCMGLVSQLNNYFSLNSKQFELDSSNLSNQSKCVEFVWEDLITGVLWPCWHVDMNFITNALTAGCNGKTLIFLVNDFYINGEYYFKRSATCPICRAPIFVQPIRQCRFYIPAGYRLIQCESCEALYLVLHGYQDPDGNICDKCIFLFP